MDNSPLNISAPLKICASKYFYDINYIITLQINAGKVGINHLVKQILICTQ